MGYGAYMTVKNERSGSIKLYITDVQCMYDNGKEGSNLSLFNDATVSSNQQLPSGSKGQYIEAKNSGTCALEAAEFTLKIEDASNSAIIGHVKFHDRTASWSADNDNEDVIDVLIDNSGDQGTIKVTVEKS